MRFSMLKHVDFAVDQAYDVLQPLPDVLESLEPFCFSTKLQRHMRGHGVGQASRLIDTGQGSQDFRRDLSCSA